MEWIGGLIVLAVLYFLHQKGIIRLRRSIKLFYKYKQSLSGIDISYKKYDGFDYYYFRLKKGQKITVFYEVTVESGSLRLEWKDSKRTYFNKLFQENDSGHFTYESSKRLHSLKLDGKDTQGGCRVHFEYE